MEQAHQCAEGRNIADLALEAVWVADDHSALDIDHALALTRAGFGTADRMETQTHN